MNLCCGLDKRTTNSANALGVIAEGTMHSGEDHQCTGQLEGSSPACSASARLKFPQPVSSRLELLKARSVCLPGLQTPHGHTASAHRRPPFLASLPLTDDRAMRANRNRNARGYSAQVPLTPLVWAEAGSQRRQGRRTRGGSCTGRISPATLGDRNDGPW